MITILEELLEKKNKELYIRYKTIEKLLIFTAESNNIGIGENYLTKLIKSFLISEKLELEGNIFWDNVVYLYDNIIKLYEDGEFRRYNTFIESKDIQFQGKTWLKENKRAILKIIEYYYESIETESRTTIYNNKYFKIENLKKRYNDKYMVTVSTPQEMTIRVMLKGKVYYKNGIFLSEGEYLIADGSYQLSSHKLLSKSIDMLVITLHKKFLEEFKVKRIEKAIQVKSTISLDYFYKMLDENFIKENIMLFVEILTLILQVNSLLPDLNLYLNEDEEKKIVNIFECIEENIKLKDDEIRERVINKFQLNNTKFDSIIEKYYDTTFKKYVLNLKIKHIINNFYNSDRSINELLLEYNIINTNNFYYNLKKYLGLSIKVLKKQSVKTT